MSKNSLSDAIANAIGFAMADFDGEHQISLTVVIDGYEFTGEEYRVKVRVMVFDHTKAAIENIEKYQDEKMREQELSRDLSDKMMSAIYHKTSYNSEEDEYAHILHHYLHHLEAHHHNIDGFTLMVHPATHDHLQMEAGVLHVSPQQTYDHSHETPTPNAMGEK